MEHHSPDSYSPFDQESATNIKVYNSQVFQQDKNTTGTESGHSMIFAPLQPESNTSAMLQQNQNNINFAQMQASETAIKKQYFDEIYHAKQVAAKRKLAYDFSLLGNGKQASVKNWNNAKSVSKGRNRLVISHSKNESHKGGLSYC